jgi:hypothetical protein
MNDFSVFECYILTFENIKLLDKRAILKLADDWERDTRVVTLWLREMKE